LGKQHITIALILPAYQEELYIARVLRALQPFGCPLVVVDDGSNDHTYEIAQQFTPHVLQHTINLGKGAALKTGCEYAFNHLHADAVVFMDSDAQHDPAVLPHFLRALKQGAPVVFGVRKLDMRMPRLRRWGNYIFSWLTRITFGTYIPDILCGFKALSRAAYAQVQWQSRDYAVEMELSARVAKKRLPFYF
jgi:glycosyltransferase involved in cell wall biosynthesis